MVLKLTRFLFFLILFKNVELDEMPPKLKNSCGHLTSRGK